MPSGTTSVGIGSGIARFATLSDGMFCALLYCIERHEAAPIRIGFPFSAYNMGVLTPSTAAVFRQRGGIRRRGVLTPAAAVWPISSAQ
ncbi:hypothetical protein P3W85_09560 [Cupriavidus basilensis]|uniref:Uncharacterized protein n=1 Tax=Cupriavidus basilensis TaxID=68895 RepID=A0ABT6AKQ6_9BURK|nr:hypothetical protein [Cupriavidus basilensis]MDF3833190.1 hypothetical protein [Cupriavidus basilensis]